MAEHNCYAGTALVTPEAQARLYLLGTVGNTTDQAQRDAMNASRQVLDDDFAARQLCGDCGYPQDNADLPTPTVEDAGRI